VITDDLVIESGGRFIGQSSIREDKTVSPIKQPGEGKTADAKSSD